MTVSLVLLGLLLGALLSIYFPLVAASAKVLGSGPLANVPFFFIAFAASVLIALATGSRWADFRKIAEVPGWQLTAGIMSAGLIIGSSFLIPRIGLGAFVVLLVAGQILAGMMYGQFGLFGAPQTELSLGKVGGAVLVVLGVWLVTFK